MRDLLNPNFQNTLDLVDYLIDPLRLLSKPSLVFFWFSDRLTASLRTTRNVWRSLVTEMRFRTFGWPKKCSVSFWVIGTLVIPLNKIEFEPYSNDSLAEKKQKQIIVCM